jgi:hypothetical protein
VNTYHMTLTRKSEQYGMATLRVPANMLPIQGSANATSGSRRDEPEEISQIRLNETSPSAYGR